MSHSDSRQHSTPWPTADQRYVWHPYTQMQTAPEPLPVVRAEGVYLHTSDGRAILDGISSWWVNLHGHNHPRINRALAAQAEKLAQVIFAGFTHEPAARLAEALVERTPSSLTKVFYSDNGSTAVEVALKMAYQYWRNRGEDDRRLFIALEGGFHGDTFGAMSVSGPSVFQHEFSDLLFEVHRVPLPTTDLNGAAADGAPESTTGDSASTPLALRRLLEREGHRVAAVIVEPLLQGAAGMRTWPLEALQEFRAATREYGIPLIADEIFTAFGRTGAFLACDHGAVAPDILCLSKGLTGGYLPLAVTLTTDEIFDGFLSEDRTRTLFHGHSFTGNALSCAVALESLAVFDDERCLERVQQLEAQFRRRLECLAEIRAVQRTRCLGAMAAMDLETSSPGYLDNLGPRLGAAFLSRDILLRPLGNVLYFLPPYAITETEVDHVFDAIEDVLRTL